MTISAYQLVTRQDGDVKHVFLSGNPALDFAATLRSRRTVPFETFVSPESLDSWFRESGVVDGDTSCRPSDVEEAVAVREAIYSLVIAKVANERYDEGALSLVNRAARTPPAVPQLTLTGRQTEATPAQALSSVARHAIEVLSGSEVPLLKECANPECTRVYIDRSRGVRREWCGMDPCGNKMKAAAYRARKREDRPRSDAMK
jgi:predicted RNA-binding Zn ribbon-like protein